MNWQWMKYGPIIGKDNAKNIVRARDFFMRQKWYGLFLFTFVLMQSGFFYAWRLVFIRSKNRIEARDSYLLFRFHDSEGNRVYPIREVFEEIIQEGRQLSSPILSANMASS